MEKMSTMPGGRALFHGPRDVGARGNDRRGRRSARGHIAERRGEAADAREGRRRQRRLRAAVADGEAKRGSRGGRAAGARGARRGAGASSMTARS